MKFNKSQKDNIIKMSNQEADDLINILGDLLTEYVGSDSWVYDNKNNPLWRFMDGLGNLSNIGS